jgi:hypothetical protein
MQPVRSAEVVEGTDWSDVVVAVQAAGASCSCGHGRQLHEHYRTGTDCALCSCARYHRPLLRRLGFGGR